MKVKVSQIRYIGGSIPSQGGHKNYATCTREPPTADSRQQNIPPARVHIFSNSPSGDCLKRLRLSRLDTWYSPEPDTGFEYNQM